MKRRTISKRIHRLLKSNRLKKEYPHLIKLVRPCSGLHDLNKVPWDLEEKLWIRISEDEENGVSW